MNCSRLTKYALLLNQTLSDWLGLAGTRHPELEDSIQTMFPNVLWFKSACVILRTPNVMLVGMVEVVMERVELTPMLPLSMRCKSSASKILSGISM